MAKEEGIQVTGKVIEALPNAMFKVKIDDQDYIVLAHLCGKMRKNFIRVIPGDKVDLEITPYDLTRGRILRREK